MKKILTELWLFIKNMLSKGTSESSKRTMGVLIIVNSIIIEYICVYKHIEAPEIIGTMFWGAIILLGAEVTTGAIQNIFSKKKDENDSKK